MIIMISLERLLNNTFITAMAPPQEGERVGVSTSMYSLFKSHYLSEFIIFERSLTIRKDY